MFISRINASADRSPWGDFFFEPVGMRGLSGARVSADSAMALSAVFRAVSLISGHIAMLPMMLRREGELKPVRGHWLQKLFKKPNRWQNGFEWRQMGEAHLLLRGNFYNEIIDGSRGEIRELIPLHPDRVRVEMLAGGDYRYRYTAQDGNERVLTRGQVWHLRGLSSNGITGISVIEAARESLGLGLAAQEYGARFFQNDARPGGVIEFPGKFADKTAKQTFRESWQESQSGMNRGKTAILENGMTYKELGITNKDAQFLESRKFQINDIARWFGVPPHKLADLDRATFSNIEQQSLEYINDCLLIWTEAWEAGIEDALLLDDEQLEVEFDFRRLLRGDSVARSTYYQSGINAGWLTRNEARADDGREPIDGLDEPLRPLNMVEEDDSEEAEDVEDAEPAQPPATPEPAEDDDTAEARMQALVRSNAARIARRMTKTSGPVDPELIAESLAIPLAAAQAWCERGRSGILAGDLTASLIELGLKK